MGNNFQFISASVSDRGLSEKRPQNEDSFLDLQQYGVFAVADGVGGAQAGDVASQMAIEILGEAFINLSPDGDPEETMKIAIERANSAIYQMSQDLPQLSSMATTIVALHLSGNVATVGHVGDSRLYRVDGSGQLFRETQDHSVVEEEVRAGRMTPEQAVNHPSRNVISRAVGAEDSVEIDMMLLIIDPDTTFMLCSDGITRHIEDWEIAALLASSSEPSEICQQMKDICHSRGAEDNLTAVIVRIPAEAAVGESADAADHEEIEQVTVAAARSPFETVEFKEIREEPEEIHALDLGALDEQQSSRADEQTFFPEDSDAIYDDQPVAQNLEAYISSSVVVPAQAAPAEREFSIYSESDHDASDKSGFIGKALPAIALMLVGILLGAAGHYFWQQTNPPPEVPPQLVAKSPDIPLTAFEESRRLVDKDPAGFITANATSPQDAEDFYLLGRALILTGKYPEAKRQFTLAKDRLSQVDVSNAKTLAAEIAMALTIIETPGASEAFAKEIAAGNTGANRGTNANLPASTNSSR